MNGLRLLPWSSPEGKPCYLATDDSNSRLSRKADEIEALQLAMGAQLLAHARAMLEQDKASSGELRFLAWRLAEALADALRVAESRGGRLLVHGEQGADERNQADQ
ncbi:hypothetical protein KN815_44760 [Streptomyces sp. 4503]|uniref:Uncharacterized protein n=1 Tax=Streptomyces niphimycinicus TaxID=2842201 RepID=A0ABS6CVD3_9ACTN|nr:hypothetical protein [Streptomyces niphimycinicus]MBU3870913.1 hypothetical protein [Streptomyces niphimycinicus]